MVRNPKYFFYEIVESRTLIAPSPLPPSSERLVATAANFTRYPTFPEEKATRQIYLLWETDFPKLRYYPRFPSNSGLFHEIFE